MGFFDRFKRRASSAVPKIEPTKNHLAFVLLKEAAMPTAEDVERAFNKYSCDGATIEVTADEDKDRPILTLRISDGTTIFALLVDMPVPKGEAEDRFPHSLASLTSSEPLPSHSAHIMVMHSAAPKAASPVKAISQFTTILAALVETSSSVGVYWGNAGATHPRDFFLTAAAECGVTPRITLWNGFSRARETDSTMSFLSYGMKQIGLPDLFLVFENQESGNALAMFFDLLAYVANRGEPIPDGDTIGADDNERIPVRSVPSPTGTDETVWKVDLAARFKT